MSRRSVAARRRVRAALPIALICAGAPVAAAAREAAAEPVRYVVGAPYQQAGRWYVPGVQPDYVETGRALVYTGAHRTADGERFDPDAVTGAHPTLPLPCLVEVSDLRTGRAVQVRLNDRSPSAAGHVVDLSPGAAEALGLRAGEAARVRVRYLGPASLQPPSPDAPPRQAELASASTAGFGVQAGAYASRTAAERVAGRLAVAGRASVVPLERGGVRLYRVIVGGLPDAQAAEQARGRVATLGFADARIVGAL